MNASANPAGSSPLARGALAQRVVPLTVTRLIPAGAGSTDWCAPGTEHRPAHPRWRGEHTVAFHAVVTTLGSSPLARGAPATKPDPKPTVGLIPAGAGSTGLRNARFLPHAAHPRWRGEHHSTPNLPAASAGSSPLARGALGNLFSIAPKNRLIPAGAGSTISGIRGSPGLGAHPRWRGEHENKIMEQAERDGSSPLARGARLLGCLAGLSWGLIPAGAGSTIRHACSERGQEAHPRWRGEHLCVMLRRIRLVGSSPLARGAPG